MHLSGEAVDHEDRKMPLSSQSISLPLTQGVQGLCGTSGFDNPVLTKILEDRLMITVQVLGNSRGCSVFCV